MNIIQFLKKRHPVFFWCCIAFSTIYSCSMIIQPLLASGGDLKILRATWKEWQALNVGVLAFSASVIVFLNSHYKSEVLREGKLTAAKTFLPETLSGIDDYLLRCSKRYNSIRTKALEHLANDGRFTMAQMREGLLAGNHKEVISKCVEHATPSEASLLSHFSRKLQTFSKNFEEQHKNMPARFEEWPNIEIFAGDQIVNLIELKALTSRLWEFTYGDRGIRTERMDHAELKSALASLKDLEDIPLEDAIERKLQSGRNNPVWGHD